jgi:hypothetical protein
MDLSNHPFTELFEQLGLPSDEASIVAFIGANRPLPEGVALADAAIWSPGQAQFLRESLAADADWAEVVDQLNLALRG